MSPAGTRRLGIVGGSGVYALDGLAGARWEKVESSFGAPSDELLLGELDGVPVAFLPRHGRGHPIPPSRVNYRANIYGFKMLGVEYLIGVSACGSLQHHVEPGHIMIPDQLFDRTQGRAGSFFDDPSAGTGGLVVHISVAEPFCPYLADICHRAVGQRDSWRSAQGLGLQVRPEARCERGSQGRQEPDLRRLCLADVEEDRAVRRRGVL